MASIPAETPKTRVPLPPLDARVVTTACEYSPVACGYKAFIWPVGTEGGPSARDNALKTDFPTGTFSGRWPSPNMHTNVTIDGRLQHVLVMPDPDAEVVNVGGNHSVRGGTLALKLYRPDGPTRDRLQRPLLRVNGTLQPITWDAATDIVAELIRHVDEVHGELAMGFKVYSYEYFENTFAATKFALGAIGTPNYAPHHNTAGGTDTPGLDDTGVDAFSAGYVDYRDADVLMIVGTDPYETKTVGFTQWIAPGGARLIHMDPRKTFTAAYALKNGGVHLQVKPGTDAWVIGAIARYILEQGWEDADFIRDHVTQAPEEIDEDGHWRRRLMGWTCGEFRDAYFNEDDYTLARASAISGGHAASIQRAAELLAQPLDGEPPKASLLYEKGLYWSHQYENTAALGNLSVLIGARGKPGRATSRMGGHQRGGASGASYPFEKSPTEFNGQKLEMDCDRWTVEGNTRMVWSIGNDWINGSGASQYLASRLRAMVRETGPQISSAVPSTAIDQLKQRVDNGGMFIVQSDIYVNDNTEFADLVLPAATWGEEDFTRNNAERRLRLYGKIMDPPATRSRIGGRSPRSQPRWGSRASTGPTRTSSSRSTRLDRAAARTSRRCSRRPRPTACVPTSCCASAARPGTRPRSGSKAASSSRRRACTRTCSSRGRTASRTSSSSTCRRPRTATSCSVPTRTSSGCSAVASTTSGRACTTTSASRT